MARLYRNSFDPERSGDMLLQLAEGCLAAFGDYGTSHGSPYAYDRDVPLVFMGAGIEAGQVSGRAVTVDLAPTLADWLGLEAPSGLDGRVLDLRAPAK